MLNIGCHLSISKGYENMGKETLEIEANTFQFLVFPFPYFHIP